MSCSDLTWYVGIEVMAWYWLFNKSPLKTKDCQFDNFFITDGTMSCHYNNLWCHQWWQSYQMDDFFPEMSSTNPVHWWKYASPGLNVSVACSKLIFPQIKYFVGKLYYDSMTELLVTLTYILIHCYVTILNDYHKLSLMLIRFHPIWLTTPEQQWWTGLAIIRNRCYVRTNIGNCPCQITIIHHASNTGDQVLLMYSHRHSLFINKPHHVNGPH